MIWKDFSREFRDGEHSFLSPSSHSWLNYSDEKLEAVYLNKLMTVRGTRMHDLAKRLIEMKVRLPEDRTTLSMYVNDAIELGLRPEQKLYYSKYCFGTADAIDYHNAYLRIHDLKTGINKASIAQLDIYAALFFLSYPEVNLGNCAGIELRIYQNCEVRVENRIPEDILPIMDKIIRYSNVLELLEDNYNDGIDTFGGGS